MLRVRTPGRRKPIPGGFTAASLRQRPGLSAPQHRLLTTAWSAGSLAVAKVKTCSDYDSLACRKFCRPGPDNMKVFNSDDVAQGQAGTVGLADRRAQGCASRAHTDVPAACPRDNGPRRVLHRITAMTANIPDARLDMERFLTASTSPEARQSMERFLAATTSPEARRGPLAERTVERRDARAHTDVPAAGCPHRPNGPT